MPRPLKTKFPCRVCRAPAQVERLREGPTAMCERCARRQSLFSTIAYRDKEVSRRLAEVDGKAETSAKLMHGVLLAMAEKLRAAACLEAVEVAASPAEQRHLVRCARGRAAEAVGHLQVNASHFEEALQEITEEAGLAVVQGGLAEEVAMPTCRNPVLQLVKAPKVH